MYDKQKWINQQIVKKNKLKAARNRKQSIEIMKNHPGYSCSDCVHGIVKSCTDHLENACEYWFDGENYFPIEAVKKRRTRVERKLRCGY